MTEYTTPLYCCTLVKPLMIQVIRIAPTMAPHADPPPMSIMMIGTTAAVKVKAPGETAVVTNA